MKKKKTLLLILLSFIFFIGLNKTSVSAWSFSDTISSIEQSGSVVTYNGEEYLALKYYGNTAVICTQFKKTTPARKTLTCEKSAWSNNVSAGVAAILKKVGTVSISGNASEKYYYGELAINEFLCNRNNSSESCVSDNRTTREVLGSYYSWYEAAVDAYNDFSTAQISLSSSKLTFTKSGSNYVSNEITISGKYDSVNISTNIGSVNKSGNKFTITIPTSKIKIGATDVTVTVTGTKKYNRAMNYDCGSTYQSVTPVKVKEIESTASKTATGQISVKASLTVQKRDITDASTPLAGAKFQITKDGSVISTNTSTTKDLVVNLTSYGKYCIKEVSAPSGYVISNTPVCVDININNLNDTIKIINKKNVIYFKKVTLDKDKKYKLLPKATLKVVDSNSKIVTDLSGKELKWTTNEQKYTVNGIKQGTYYLVEEKAPTGYVIANRVKFVVNSDGTISSDNLESKLQILEKNTLTVVMINKLTETKFKKIDAVTNKVVSGAVFQILDKDKKEISDSSGKKLYVFETLNKDYIIEGLETEKEYYLKEISAPKGYKLNEDLVKFKIDTSGKIYVYDESKKSFESVTSVQIENYPKINVHISKQDVTTGKELPGATLVLLDKDKKQILDENGKNKYEWVSTDKSYLIDDLDPGEYCLKETIAPKGYTKTEEVVCFKIDYTNLENKVVMKNSPIINVPNTAKTVSIPVAVLSIVLFGCGTGIIIYIVRKNKKI